MDYIDFKKQRKLYVGTNRGVILTIDISKELDYDVHDDLDNQGMEMDDDRLGQDMQINSTTKKGPRFEEFEDDEPSTEF
jgi:hypothetical protein